MISLSKFVYTGVMVVLFAVMASSCLTNNDPKCGNIPCLPDGIPHQKLSEYSLFEEPMHDLVPREFMLPYDLNTQLFSDYAQKLRIVYIPDGMVIPYKEEGVLEFPIGSVLVKNFYYDHDLREPRDDRTILETRLLVYLPLNK